jgi:hypothetical protein
MTQVQLIVINGLIDHWRGRLRELGKKQIRSNSECKILRRSIKKLEKEKTK